MSAFVSKSLPPASPIKFEEQGIVSILGSDMDLITKIPPSLRRTISADMSSKKWLAQNGFSPMKKIASFGDLVGDHSSNDNYEDHNDEQLNMLGQDDVWRSIQLQKEKIELEKPTQMCVWSSILAQKENEPNNVLPPYVHPLVKRSSSTLSEKSLQICTESLGSETGSDGFSSFPPSEEGDREDEKEDAQQEEEEEKEEAQEQLVEELGVAKYNSYPSKKIAPRSFPPPLPSLPKGDGPSLYMNSRRNNGRLVLKAVSVSQQNNFQAERQDGRLLLTLINHPTLQDANQEDTSEKTEEVREVFKNIENFEKSDIVLDDYGRKGEDEEVAREEDVEKQKGVKEMVLALEKSPSLMKRLMGLNNKVPTWSNKLNRGVNLMVVHELTQVPQSLPSASFNAYEYFWRNKAKRASITNPITQKCTPLKDNTIVLAKGNKIKAYEHQDMMVMRRSNKSDYLVPLMKGCNENRKSLLIWHPYCIATS